jgi:RHS repeat-associated protein
MVTDDSGRSLSENDYYPFGTTMTRTYQEQFDWSRPYIDSNRFAGQRRDFLGSLNVDDTEYLDYMHARYYDPNLGRFLSVDPVFDLKRASPNPQMWNRYAYVVNNPLRYNDPTGRELPYDPNMFTDPHESLGAATLAGLMPAAVMGGVILAPEVMAAAPFWGVRAMPLLNALRSWGAAATGQPSLTQFERATAQLANKLQFTETTLQHMKEAERMVPRSTLAEAILTGSRSADPQGAVGAIQVTQSITVNGKDYVLRIIYREADYTILHFGYAPAK